MKKNMEESNRKFVIPVTQGTRIESRELSVVSGASDLYLSPKIN